MFVGFTPSLQLQQQNSSIKTTRRTSTFSRTDNSECKNKIVKKNWKVLGESINHVVLTQCRLPLIPIQEKGRCIPIHIQAKVGEMIQKLIRKNTVKLDKCTSNHFFARKMITVKKDVTKKLDKNAKQNKKLCPNRSNFYTQPLKSSTLNLRMIFARRL